MSTAAEVRFSPPKSRSDNSEAREYRKAPNISYKREVLLSLAELARCKRLPRGFDSSVLCEPEDASCGSSSTDSESGRSNGKLPLCLPIENGILGKGALSKESGCVGGVSAPRIQANGCHPEKQDSGRWDTNLSQHLKQDPECGLLGRDAILREPGYLTGVSAPVVQGSNYHLLNRSIAPYRPPHLYKMNLHSRRESKDIYADKPSGSSDCPSLERQEEIRKQNESYELEKAYKANERKEKNVSEEHKGNLDSNDSPNDKMIADKSNQSMEVVVPLASNAAGCYSSVEAAACGKKFPISANISEKGFETNFLSNSPIQEDRNVKMDQIDNFISSSSNSVDQFIEEEKNPACGITLGDETDESEVHIASSKNSDKHELRSFSAGGIAPEVYVASQKVPYEWNSGSFSSQRSGISQNISVHSVTEKVLEQLCSSSSSIMLAGVLKEIGQSLSSEVIENHLIQHHHGQAYDTENKKSNTACYFDLPQQPLTLAKKGIDERDPPTAPSKLNFSNSAVLGSDLTTEATQGADSTNEFHKKGCAAGLTKHDLLGNIGFPTPINNEIIPLPVDTFIRKNNENTIPFGCVEQSALKESKGEKPASADVDNKKGLDSLIEQKLELNSANGFAKQSKAIDEICLPDEDSLITLEDLIFPGYSMLTADDSSTEGVLLASRIPDNNVHKATSFNVSLGERKFPSSLGNAALASVKKMDSEPSCDNTVVRSYPCPYKNPGRALFPHSEVRFSDLNTYYCDPLRQSGFPINFLQDSSKNPFVELTRSDNSVLRPASQQMLPCVFPHQFFGPPTGTLFDCPIHKTLAHSYWLNQTQNPDLNSPQHCAGPIMHSPGQNRLFGTKQATRMHPPWP